LLISSLSLEIGPKTVLMIEIGLLDDSLIKISPTTISKNLAYLI
jgi:hypothetical protein